MSAPTAVIYARISRDAEGEGLGVARQKKDCLALAERKGWTVGDVLVENDTSAFSGKKRPLYTAMLDGIRAGTYDAVIAWHPDRLHRSPRELEDFIDLIDSHHLAVETVTAGHWDLSTPAGRMNARNLGNLARYESEHKSERLRRKHEEIAEKGGANGGGRPFGFESDRITHRPDEVERIREAAARVLAGDSLYAIAKDWTAQGVGTVTGAAWSTTALKAFLTRGRVAGLREHRGEITGPAVWEPILDESTWRRVRSILTDPSRRQSPRRRYLLSGGIVRCGICDQPMKAAPRHGGARAYACLREREGCGGVSILADPLEEFVLHEAEIDGNRGGVLGLLDGPDLAAAIARAEHDTDAAGVEAEIAADEAKLTELADMWGSDEITRAEWQRLRASIDARLKVNRGEAARRAPSPLTAIDGPLTKAWPDLSIDQRAAIIAAVVTVRVGKAKGGARVDLTRVAVLPV